MKACNYLLSMLYLVSNIIRSPCYYGSSIYYGLQSLYCDLKHLASVLSSILSL